MSVLSTVCKIREITTYPREEHREWWMGDEGTICLVFKNEVYTWDSTADTGFPCCIQHNGNFLDGTETRGPVSESGDWVTGLRLYTYKTSDGETITCDHLTRNTIGYGANGYPHIDKIRKIFDTKKQPPWGQYEILTDGQWVKMETEK